MPPFARTPLRHHVCQKRFLVQQNSIVQVVAKTPQPALQRLAR